MKRLPKGMGSVCKLSGNRRKPYAARVQAGTTEGGNVAYKYLGYYESSQEAIQALIEYNKYPYNNWENSYVKEKNGLATLTYFISLKKDITDNEIKRVVDTVSNHYNVKINYIIDDDVLCLEIVSDDMQKCNFVYKDLEIRLRDRERINQ